MKGVVVGRVLVHYGQLDTSAQLTEKINYILKLYNIKTHHLVI